MPPEARATTGERPAREYATLNAMRGVAALAVVFFHGTAIFGVIMPSGYLAVDFFFVLSGFVIAHAYEHRLRTRISRGEFLAIRLIRFYPLYVAGFAIGVVYEILLLATGNAFALTPGELVAAIGAGLFFLPMPLATRGGNLFPVNIPSWSLFFELLVNMLYAWLLPWIRTSALILACVVSGVALAWSMGGGGIGHLGVTASTLAAGCARTIFSFSLGLIIYRTPWRPIRAPMLLLPLGTALCFAVPVEVPFYEYLFVFLLSPALVLLGASVEPPAVLMRHARFLGLVSFPIYAVHRPILNLAMAAAHRYGVAPGLIGWPVLIVMLLACGTIAIRYDEAARRFLSGLRRRRVPRDPAEAAAP